MESPEAQTIPAVARSLQVSPTTIRRMIARGELPVVRLGVRLVRVPTAAVSALIGLGRSPLKAPTRGRPRSGKNRGRRR